MLYYILYSSEATGKNNTATFKHLLEQCHHNNMRQGLTGLLFFNNGRFMQILEGEVTRVRQTYELIRHDPRHTNITTLAEGGQNSRNFPDWAMAFEGFTDGQTLQMPDYINLKHNQLLFNNDAPDHHPALQYLKEFYYQIHPNISL